MSKTILKDLTVGLYHLRVVTGKKSSCSRRKHLPTASYYDCDGYSVNNYSEESRPSSIVYPQGSGSYQSNYHDFQHNPCQSYHLHHQSSHIRPEPEILDYYASPCDKGGDGRGMSSEYRYQDHDCSDIASGIFSFLDHTLFHVLLIQTGSKVVTKHVAFLCASMDGNELSTQLCKMDID